MNSVTHWLLRLAYRSRVGEARRKLSTRVTLVTCGGGGFGLIQTELEFFR